MKFAKNLGKAYRSRLAVALAFLLLSSCFVFLVLAAPPSGTQTLASGGTVGTYSSLKLDSAGNPNIVYRDETTGSVNYAKWNGAAWVIQTVDVDGRWISFDVDSGGNPHIVYANQSGTRLVCAEYNGSTWSTSVVAEGSLYNYTSLAVDSNNVTHIVFSDIFGLQYAVGGSSGWSSQSIDSVSCLNALALDSSDRPHVVYSASTGALQYARWDGSTWNTQTVDAGPCSYPSIALSPNDSPSISYRIVGAPGSTAVISDLKYATLNGSSWTVQTASVRFTDTYHVGYNSIALDSNSNPHISYVDPTDGFLKYTRLVGSSWMAQTVDSSGFVGEYNSIALDSLGNVQISYFDNLNGDLKYTSFPLPTSTPTPSPSPTASSTAEATATPSPTPSATASPSPNATESPNATYTPAPLETWPPWAFETETPSETPTETPEETPAEEGFFSLQNMPLLLGIAAVGIFFMHMGIYFGKRRSRKKREKRLAREARRGAMRMPPADFPPDGMPLEGQSGVAGEMLPEGEAAASAGVEGAAQPLMEGAEPQQAGEGEQQLGVAETGPAETQQPGFEPQPVEYEPQPQYEPEPQTRQQPVYQQPPASNQWRPLPRYSTPMRTCPRCHRTFRDFYSSCPYCRYELKRPR